MFGSFQEQIDDALMVAVRGNNTLSAVLAIYWGASPDSDHEVIIPMFGSMTMTPRIEAGNMGNYDILAAMDNPAHPAVALAGSCTMSDSSAAA